MARTRTTIRRIDPWSILKFAFVANLVLLAIELLVGAFAWAMIRRLELIETVCGLAGKLGVDECAVDGQQLFDTLLVLGLLGVVIQTGVLVFMTFLANLIFDLVGGIVVTLDDEAPVYPASGGRISSRSSSRKPTLSKPSRGSKPKANKPSAMSTMAAKPAESTPATPPQSTSATPPQSTSATPEGAGSSTPPEDTSDTSDTLFGGS